MKITEKNIATINAELRSLSPEAIINFVLAEVKCPVLTTNFRPFEAAILHATTRLKADLKVIWCDTGYNTPETYAHAENLISKLQLNVSHYVPRQTKAHRDVVIGIPGLDDPKHQLFAYQVKLEPFARAMNAHQPDAWFTNLRIGQTKHRNSLDILSFSKEGVLKVSPFYYWSDTELDAYLAAHDLPNEHRYFDPTKVLENRECGLHS